MQDGPDGGVTVMGDTVNVASRLQALAKPGSAVMSEATHRLVEGLVETSFFGEHDVKGKSELQKAYRLDAIREGATRFGAKLHRGLTKFIGRDQELEKLEPDSTRSARASRSSTSSASPASANRGLCTNSSADRQGGRAGPVGELHTRRPADALPGFHRDRAWAFRLGPEIRVPLSRANSTKVSKVSACAPRKISRCCSSVRPQGPRGRFGRSGRGSDRLAYTRTAAKARGGAQSVTPLILVFKDLHWLDSASEDLLAKTVAMGPCHRRHEVAA